MSRPSIDNPPELGDSSPAMSRNKVVFPDPDGPSTTSSSPERTLRSTASRAGTPPGKPFDNCRNSMPAKESPLRLRIPDPSIPR
jgi:hypothetical protein